MLSMTRILATIVGVLLAANAGAYPLDDYKRTGIARLYAFDLVQKQLLASGNLKPGSLWDLRRVKLRLLDQPGLTLPKPDAAFSKKVRSLLGGDANAYGVGILDLSNPAQPRYAEVNDTKAQQPGSVGKMMVMVAFFQGLADAFPKVRDRERVLRETIVTANQFIRKDSHNVPVYEVGDPQVIRRPIQEGDRANLWTYLDWMVSASSNAAASMVISQTLLLKHFGARYPVSDAKAAAFFKNTPKAEMSKIFASAMVTPLKRSGMNPGQLQQGSFFTREGNKYVSSVGSVSTARELVRYCLRTEQGKLVDRWSSLEIKRLLYLTDVRIRYASSPTLNDVAVYFKSGSLFSCQKEAGFDCQKFMGNRMNYMNSVAMVETKGRKPLHYIAAVLSNVLRKNSKDLHVSLAGTVHRLIKESH
jgi:hypothetical protein